MASSAKNYFDPKQLLRHVLVWKIILQINLKIILYFIAKKTKLYTTVLRKTQVGSVPLLAFMTMGPEVPQHMPWLSGQPDAGPQVFSSQADLILILLTHRKDERLSQPCTVSGSNHGPVAWQCKALTTTPPGFSYHCTVSIKSPLKDS